VGPTKHDIAVIFPSLMHKDLNVPQYVGCYLQGLGLFFFCIHGLSLMVGLSIRDCDEEFLGLELDGRLSDVILVVGG